MYPIKLLGKKCCLSLVDDAIAERVAGWSNDLEIGIRTATMSTVQPSWVCS